MSLVAPRSGPEANRFGDPATLVREARRLDDVARHHKGESARHRRLAQEARERQAAIERQCAALGIAVVYVPPRRT